MGLGGGRGVRGGRLAASSSGQSRSVWSGKTTGAAWSHLDEEEGFPGLFPGEAEPSGCTAVPRQAPCLSG